MFQHLLKLQVICTWYNCTVIPSFCEKVSRKLFNKVYISNYGQHVYMYLKYVYSRKVKEIWRMYSCRRCLTLFYHIDIQFREIPHGQVIHNFMVCKVLIARLKCDMTLHWPTPDMKSLSVRSKLTSLFPLTTQY